MHVQFTTENIQEQEAPVIVDAGKTNNLQQGKPEKVTYPFVDLIRFVATLGIVYIHTEFLISKSDPTFFHKVPHVQVYFIFKQLFKFSTICYFMLAGFLLGDKIEGGQRFNYFKRRVNVIAKPYILAAGAFITVLILFRPTGQNINLKYILDTCKDVVFYTPFWYIPNFLTCLLVIVCFAKYARSVYFGVLLFVITLVYTYLNVYSPNHSGSHTTALFGFVFYMWLGLHIKQAGLVSKMQKLNLKVLSAVVLLIFILSNYESWYLFNYTHAHDNLNTLRISNQLYSVAMFIFMVRCCAPKPNFGILRPRQETYGIYLYHSFFVFFITRGFENWVCAKYHINLLTHNVFELVIANLLNFIICYIFTTALIKLFIRFKLAYLPYE
jgi:hypothetical protein